MTPNQLELIAQQQKRLDWLQSRIDFHGRSRLQLIEEAADIQRGIDAIKAMREDALCWNVNEANEGQD